MTRRTPPYIQRFAFRVENVPELEAVDAAQVGGVPVSSTFFKVLAACAVLVSLAAFVLVLGYSDEADSSAYGPHAGAPVVHLSAPTH